MSVSLMVASAILGIVHGNALQPGFQASYFSFHNLRNFSDFFSLLMNLEIFHLHRNIKMFLHLWNKEEIKPGFLHYQNTNFLNIFV